MKFKNGRPSVAVEDVYVRNLIKKDREQRALVMLLAAIPDTIKNAVGSETVHELASSPHHEELCVDVFNEMMKCSCELSDHN